MVNKLEKILSTLGLLGVIALPAYSEEYKKFTFGPGAEAAAEQYLIGRDTSERAKAYETLDGDKDGHITKREVKTFHPLIDFESEALEFEEQEKTEKPKEVVSEPPQRPEPLPKSESVSEPEPKEPKKSRFDVEPFFSFNKPYGTQVFTEEDLLGNMMYGFKNKSPMGANLDSEISLVTKYIDQNIGDLDFTNQTVELSLALEQKQKEDEGRLFSRLTSSFLPRNSVTSTPISTTRELWTSNKTLLEIGYELKNLRASVTPMREKRMLETEVTGLTDIIKTDLEGYGLQARASLGNLYFLVSQNSTSLKQDGSDLADITETILGGEYITPNKFLVSAVSTQRKDEDRLNNSERTFKELNLSLDKIFDNVTVGVGSKDNESETLYSARLFFIPGKGDQDRELLYHLANLQNYDKTRLPATKAWEYHNQINNIIRALPDNCPLLVHAGYTEQLGENLDTKIDSYWGIRFMKNNKGMRYVIGLDKIDKETGKEINSIHFSLLDDSGFSFFINAGDTRDKTLDTERENIYNAGIGFSTQGRKTQPRPKPIETDWGYDPSSEYTIVK